MSNALFTNAIRDNMTAIVDRVIQPLCNNGVVPDEVYDDLVGGLVIESKEFYILFKSTAEWNGNHYRVSGRYDFVLDQLYSIRFGIITLADDN